MRFTFRVSSSFSSNKFMSFESGLIQNQWGCEQSSWWSCVLSLLLQGVLRKSAAVSLRCAVCACHHTHRSTQTPWNFYTISPVDGQVNPMGFTSKVMGIKETNLHCTQGQYFGVTFCLRSGMVVCSTPVLMVSFHIIPNMAHFTTDFYVLIYYISTLWLEWGALGGEPSCLRLNVKTSLSLFFSTKHMNFSELASFLSFIFKNTYTSLSKLFL